MTVRRFRLALMLFLAAMLPFGVAAQDQDEQQDDFFGLEGDVPEEEAAPVFENYVDIGAGYLSEDSFKYGKYTGLTDEGIEPLFSFRLQHRPAWDGDNTTHWRMEGFRVRQDGRRLEAVVGQQGTQKLAISYRETPRFLIEDAVTPFRDVGSTFLTLPADWETTGGSTADMPGLRDSLQSVDIETKRRRFQVAYERQLPADWTFNADYRRETKEGTRAFGAVIGTNGGNPRSAILPAPTDFVYDIVDLNIQYDGDAYQVGFGYYGSFFENERNSLTWENPFGQFSGWAPGVGFPDGLGRLALEPDNQFNQVRAFGQYRFSSTTVLTGTAAYGRMEQDEDFLFYTVNRNLEADRPLPRESLDGEINTTLVDIRLASRPFDRFHLTTGLRLDDRENETPRDVYYVVHGDAGHQDPPGSGRINLPYSYTKKDFKLDGTYRLASRTRLTAGYSYAEEGRDFSEVNKSDEQGVKLGFSAQPTDTASIKLDVSREERDVDEYIGNLPFRISHEPGGTAGDDFENHPLLRKYYLAGRDRDKVSLRADYFPMARISLGLSSSYSRDDYDENTFGLNEARVQAHTVDMGYVPADDVTMTAFYTHERFDADMRGRSWPGFAPQLAFDPAQNWFMSSDDEVDTVGLSVNVEDIGRRLGMKTRSNGQGQLDFGVDYLFSRSRSEIEVTGAANIQTAPLPDLFTRLSSVSVSGRYQATAATSLRVGVEYETYSSRNFALDGTEVDTLANVLGLGNQSPDYDVTWVTFSFNHRF